MRLPARLGSILADHDADQDHRPEHGCHEHTRNIPEEVALIPLDGTVRVFTEEGDHDPDEQRDRDHNVDAEADEEQCLHLTTTRVLDAPSPGDPRLAAAR